MFFVLYHACDVQVSGEVVKRSTYRSADNLATVKRHSRMSLVTPVLTQLLKPGGN